MTIIVNAVSFGSLLACGVLLCPTEGNAQGPHIAVPEVESGRVVVDGRFAPGEWEGAYRYEASERLEVYFLADSADLCIGFKFLDDVEADFVAEVYIAINEDEFLTLHSSGALGEGTSAFSPGLRGPAFAVGNAVGWQSNVTGTGVRSEGKEFRISRGKLPGATIKAAGGMIVVSATIRERAGFPGAFGFESPAGWMELVLPGTMLRRDVTRQERIWQSVVLRSADHPSSSSWALEDPTLRIPACHAMQAWPACDAGPPIALPDDQSVGPEPG